MWTLLQIHRPSKFLQKMEAQQKKFKARAFNKSLMKNKVLDHPLPRFSLSYCCRSPMPRNDAQRRCCVSRDCWVTHLLLVCCCFAENGHFQVHRSAHSAPGLMSSDCFSTHWLSHAIGSTISSRYRFFDPCGHLWLLLPQEPEFATTIRGAMRAKDQPKEEPKPAFKVGACCVGRGRSTRGASRCAHLVSMGF